MVLAEAQLVRAIVFQQLSGSKAAGTIHGRVCDVIGDTLSPKASGARLTMRGCAQRALPPIAPFAAERHHSTRVHST
jgi:hypothetical protein